MPGFRQTATLMYALLALLALAAPAGALDVEIVAPRLRPGMASLEAMLGDAALEFSADLAALVEEALLKPAFMRGFTGAAATLSLLPGLSIRGDAPAVALGSAASAWSADFSAQGLAALKALRPEDDLEAGLAVQPLLVQATIPLKRAARGLWIDAWLAYLDADGASFGLRSFAAGASTALLLIAPSSGRPSVAWSGVRLGAGLAYSRGTVSMLVEPGAIYQRVPLDPDGPGPLVAQTATLRLEPSVKAGVTTAVSAGHASIMSGVELFRVIELAVGGGCGLYAGSSAVSLESDDELLVLGYLAELVEEPGRIKIGGSAAPIAASGLYPFLAAKLSFKVGSFSLSIPAAWSIPKGLGLAALAELSL